jgi:photosystem II stability/assembly factor-like uncharacterized protein
MRGVAYNGAGVALLVGDGGGIHRFASPGTWNQSAGSPYEFLAEGGASAFASPDRGLVTGSTAGFPLATAQSVIFRTGDGGNTWDPRVLFATHITNVEFAPNAGGAYAVGTQQLDGVASSVILKSTDDGASWTMLWSSAALGEPNAIAFASGTHGVAVGRSGVFMLLDNDNVTTGSLPLAPPGGTPHYWDVAFADASTAIAVGGRPGPTVAPVVARSTDGGASWVRILPISASGRMTGVAFASPAVGIAVSAGGSVIRTSDGGATWQPVAATNPLYAVAFASPTYGIAVGADHPLFPTGAALETTDGGLSWVSIPTPSNAPTGVACLAPFHAILTGPNLQILEYGETPVPTLISSFEVAAKAFAVTLRWSVRDDANLARFMIHRSGGAVEKTIDLSGTSRSFRDEGVAPGRTYEYQLFAIDSDGSVIPSAPVSVTIPGATLELLPNQPNPFNPSTTIRFVVPERGRVRLAVYDVAGRRVVTLVDDTRDAGVHAVEWNGLDARGNRAASGVYMSRLDAGKHSATRKMVLLK